MVRLYSLKKQSGATITNLYLSGYTKQIDMKDGGPLANVLIDGTAATTTANYNTGTQVDIASWTWKKCKIINCNFILHIT